MVALFRKDNVYKEQERKKDMTADSADGFEYEPAAQHTSAEQRRHYWAVAIGLQRVDGLEVSPYLRELAVGYESGTYTLSQTGKLIRAYHHRNKEESAHEANGNSSYLERKSDAGGEDGVNRLIAPKPAGVPSESTCAHHAATLEADLVSQRIAELLEGTPFLLMPDVLKHIHRYLFQDLDPNVYHPGEFKTERMVKQEPLLNGDSVLYADPLMYQTSLDFAFREEATREYGSELHGADLENFTRTVSRLWQVHPFAEGNTRTVAVFSEMYLNYLGFPTSNEPFELHASYFRGALVRANYRNAPAKVLPSLDYLIRFYDNVINNAGHSLNEEDLMCPELFERPELLRNIDPAEALARRS